MSSEDLFDGEGLPPENVSPVKSTNSCEDIFAEEGLPTENLSPVQSTVSCEALVPELTSDCVQSDKSRRRPRLSGHRRIGMPVRRSGESEARKKICSVSDPPSVDDSTINQGRESADPPETSDPAGHLFAVPTTKAYKKRRGKFSTVKKIRKPKGDNVVDSDAEMPEVPQKKRKTSALDPQKNWENKQHIPILSSEDRENGGIVGNDDGDDHLEVEFIHKTPDLSNLVIPAPEDIQSSQNSDNLIDNFPSEASAIEAMAFDLKVLLDQCHSKWNVDTVNEAGRMFLMCKLPNVAVERSIHWTKEGTEIFIHHQRLPEDNYIWNVESPDSSNLTKVAEYLKQLSSVVESAKVCEGITTYQQYWESCVEQGFAKIEPDIYQGEECLRSEACTLVYMESKRCVECARLRIALKKRQARVINAGNSKDASKINNRYLPKKLLLNKTVKLQAEKIALKQQNKNLRKRIRKLISKDTISLDQEFSQDISKILKDNADKMSDIQKLFWSEQLRAIAKQRNPRSVRWCPMMIKIAIHLQSLSPSAYEYLQDSGILKLPSQRRLYDFTHFIEAKDGVQEHIINRIKLESEKPGTGEEYKSFYNLLFDEMTIRSNLVVSRDGNIVGYTKLTEVENSIKDLESHLQNQLDGNPEDVIRGVERKLAKKALVFMLQGISSPVHAVVGIYSTDDLTAQQLHTRAWDVVYHLESRGLKILCLICDGASCNRKFFNMHEKWDRSCQFTYATKNLASGENRPIFFIVDPPHLMKTLRNCLSNSHGHKKSRAMVKNNQVLSWEAIEHLYQVSVQDKYKRHRLTMAHIRLTAFSRMNVKLATQTVSNSVSNSLADYKDDPRLQSTVTPALIEYLSTVNIFFDCLNGSNDPDGKRNKVNKNLLPYTDLEDQRFQHVLKDQVLKFFQDWHEEVHSIPNLKAEDRERMMISRQAYESLHITVLGFCGAVQYLLKMGAPSIDAKVFNQDKLEQYFGIMRQKGGGDSNVTFHTFTTRSNALDAAQPAILAGKKGNTLSTRGPLQVNQTPLPVRKKKRLSN